MHDTLIKNGTIIDGSGNPMYTADLAINEGVITEIGELQGESTRAEIDAAGMYVAPGFIDMANRSDVYWRLLSDTSLESLLRQGVTTIVGGNSGSSLAPIYNDQMFRSTQKWADVSKVNINWQSMEEFLRVVADRHITMNFATLVGHGTLRRGIIGDEMRPLSGTEMLTLRKYIEDAMDQGALGVSLGLIYTHGQSTTSEEMRMIGELVAARDGYVAVHVRDEGAGLIDAIDETLLMAEHAGVRTHITHLKAVGKQHWPLMKQAMERIDMARMRGAHVTFDVYPYAVTGSVLYTFLPAWVTEGGRKMLLSRLKNESIRTQVIKELVEARDVLASAIVSIAPHAEELRGRTIAEIARDRDVRVEELIIDLLVASEGRVIILCDALLEENVTRAIDDPYAVITSNSPGYTITPTIHNLRMHPRSFGAFPRLFARYVRDKKTLSWEEAIYKCTAKAADICGIRDRGRLQVGFRGDVVVFDPEKIRDTATIEEPLSYAEGVRYVIVNGMPVVAGGQRTGIRSGHVIAKV